MSDETFNVYERTATLTGNSDTGVAEAGDGRTLAGYAVKWNDVAHVFERGLEFEEQILPGSYVQPNPPKLLFEHGQSPQLGRLPIGRIKVGEDAVGLRVSGRLFQNATVAPIAEAAREGELGLSLRFVVPPGYEKWEQRSGELPLHIVGGMFVREISLTAFPAYSQAIVTARSGLEISAAARARHLWITRTRITADAIR
ncbi:MAG TPA: HK97 family phage prohead protease [Candidatus Dormibacteraeota bacterium]